MRRRSTSDNFELWWRSPLLHFIAPFFQACFMFSTEVIYSRLLNRLFSLSRSLWFTVNLLSPWNASITSLCTLNVWALRFLSTKVNCGYPRISLRIFKIIPAVVLPIFLKYLVTFVRGMDRTLPMSLTSYLPSYPGIVRHFSILIFTVIFTGCATVELPDAYLYVTLPASGNGFGVNTLTGNEIEIPASKWQKMSRRGVILLPEDWAKIKLSLLKACIQNECKQSVGALDGLFYAIDDALKKIP